MRSAFFILSALALSANAFSPAIMATRAIKKSAPKATTGTKVVAKKPVVNNPFASNPFAKKEVVAKKVVAKKVVAKKVVAKKVVAKKVVAKKVVSKPAAMNSFKMPTVKSPVRSGSKKAPPASKGRPSFDTSSIKFNVGESKHPVNVKCDISLPLTYPPLFPSFSCPPSFFPPPRPTLRIRIWYFPHCQGNSAPRFQRPQASDQA